MNRKEIELVEYLYTGIEYDMARMQKKSVTLLACMSVPLS